MDTFVWLRADDTVGPWEARRELIEAAGAIGVDGIVVDGADVHRARSLFDGDIAAFHEGDDGAVLEVAEAEGSPGDIVLVGKDGEGDGTISRPGDPSESGDLARLRDLQGDGGAFVRVDDEDGMRFAEWAATEAAYVIVTRPDWEIIPLENLLAEIGSMTTVVPTVDSVEGAETAFETLEQGADGILVETADISVLESIIEVRDRLRGAHLPLSWATVVDTESTGMADRVCVDTGSMLDDDEGLLVGSHARGLAFIHGETADGPYTNPRPFRVNAGAVHAYVLVPDGQTRYLSELRSGDRVIVASTDGTTRESVVGRIKIERRPMRRISLEHADGDRIELLVQEAETVRLHTRDGGPVAVTELTPGVEVAIYHEDVARHFGTPVEERLIER